MQTPAVDALMAVGLNQLEAEVYTLLVSHEPITAYRIGQLLRKPTANIYKSVESLADKGAVLIEEGTARRCRAVPPGEFLRQLERSFVQKTRQVAETVVDAKLPLRDESIYQLQSVPMLLERCRSMLDRCTTIAVIDAFPKPFEAIRDAVTQAIARGVEVFVQLYQPADIAGEHVVVAYESPEILAHWNSQQLNVVVDGAELLLGLMSQDMTAIYQAVWSESLYLSCIMHAGLMREHTVHRVMAALDSTKPDEEVRRILLHQKFFHTSAVPGQQALFQRFTSGPDVFSREQVAPDIDGGHQ